MTSDNGNGAPSPRSFAIQHQRPRDSFIGCSRITDYELLGKLGEGTFGEVHKAKSRRNGTLVALKKIIMHNEKDGFPITALREIKLLKLLSHKNVLRLEEMAVEHHSKITDKRKRPIMYMVFPYMDHDLSGLLDNPSVHFTVPQIKCYLMQLLEGLRYLHDSHILHRDMKAANLLINNCGILQIADFGLARHYDGPIPKAGGGGGDGRREYTSLVVTRWYRPPELLLNLKKYTTAIDMWGVGCVFGEMLLGKPILAGESDKHQLEIIFDLVGSPTEQNMPGWKQLPGAEGLTPRPRPASLSQRFREHGQLAINLLKELLTLDWRKRINAIDALEHPYFKEQPYPAKPENIPRFEDSHELDRRKFHDRKAALPPAPKGGTVGVGAFEGPNADIRPTMVVPAMVERTDVGLPGQEIGRVTSIHSLRGHRRLSILGTGGMDIWNIETEIGRPGTVEEEEEEEEEVTALTSTPTSLATEEGVMTALPAMIGLLEMIVDDGRTETTEVEAALL
ncbi:hypothetical protein DL766_008210 [Monosporascus sp. MC13-8B]|uniref:Protein kinase domain-containing protein n=1 Tax=Monosporascus cannonballus TaxID=155416 RepID=A0ABY0H028_9PEZI|nr:hypothetical protein DL762_008199 [Monosporascus cannonballus]RYP20351.1 hypothetical protein DL766_008210 [Monosporascus sp. MC13-8B]